MITREQQKKYKPFAIKQLAVDVKAYLWIKLLWSVTRFTFCIHPLIPPGKI